LADIVLRQRRGKDVDAERRGGSSRAAEMLRESHGLILVEELGGDVP